MVPFLDLKKINAQYRDEIMQSVSKFIDSGSYIGGEEIEYLREFDETIELAKLTAGQPRRSFAWSQQRSSRRHSAANVLGGLERVFNANVTHLHMLASTESESTLVLEMVRTKYPTFLEQLKLTDSTGFLLFLLRSFGSRSYGMALFVRLCMLGKIA